MVRQSKFLISYLSEVVEFIRILTTQKLITGEQKILTGKNLGRVFNSRCVRASLCHAITLVTKKQSNVKLKTQPKQVLGSQLSRSLLIPMVVFTTTSIFFKTYKWPQWTRVLPYTRRERLTFVKHSSLLGPIVSYKGNSVVNMALAYRGATALIIVVYMQRYMT